MAKKLPTESVKAWWTYRHPCHQQDDQMWEMNERRTFGGLSVLDELRPFDWETLPNDKDGIPRPVFSEDDDDIDITQILAKTAWNIKPGDHYRFRQKMATYLNFPEMLITAMVGNMMSRAPEPGGALDFGKGMGKVNRTNRNRSDPTNAELVYFNADGVGNDGAQWDNYWGSALGRAMVTGHRWMYIDAPAGKPQNRAEMVRFNRRPYVTDFSPRSAPQYHFMHGQLQMVVFEKDSRHLEMDGHELIGNDGCTDYLVMTRRGYDELESPDGKIDFSKGGWWLIDPDGKVISNGNWDKTLGEIPVFPLYARRAIPTKGNRSISVPLTTELGQSAIGYMNIASAADFDAWDAAGSVQFLRGVDEEGYDLAIKKRQEGSQWIPLPAVVDSEGHSQAPMVQDSSMGAVVATVFDMALKRKLEEAARLAATAATQAPDSSGLSKSAGFSEAKVPRLAMLASELEAAQNIALRYLELRFGVKDPSAQTIWTRKFSLVELSDEIESFFNLESLAGIHSKTLDAKALVLAARDKNLITDNAEAAVILQEYVEAARKADLAVVPGTAVAPTKKKKAKSPSSPSGRGLKGAEPAAKEILSPTTT